MSEQTTLRGALETMLDELEFSEVGAINPALKEELIGLATRALHLDRPENIQWTEKWLKHLEAQRDREG